MSERVQCAECERQYDSDEHPFCPRCGATARQDPVGAAQNLARRHDPRRRRVQAAGVIMVSTGALVLIAGIVMLASAGSIWSVAGQLNDDDAIAAVGNNTATTVNITLLLDGAPAAGVPLTLSAPNTDYTSSLVTDANGHVSFSHVMYLVLALDVGDETSPVDPWRLEFIAVSAGNDPSVLEATLEWRDQSYVDTPLMGEGVVEGAVRVLGIGALLLGITPVVGGIAALRLKGHMLAFFGAIVGGFPWLFLFMASMSFMLLIVMALFVLSAVFVRQGRDLFQ